MTTSSRRSPLLDVPDGSAEPVVHAWTPIEPEALLARLGIATHTPAVLAVDGRSGAGKSTLAAQLAAVVPDAAVLATDDVAWHHSMFGWARDLIDHVVTPFRRGSAVHYRPPGWVAKGRSGALSIPPNRSLLIIEGVGSSQRAMTAALDASVWVQSDAPTARVRGIERDVASGVNGDRTASIAFWDAWMNEELPFLEQDAPWSRAAVFVAGVRPDGTEGLLVSF